MYAKKDSNETRQIKKEKENRKYFVCLFIVVVVFC